ncbi:MAG: pitrilysin family protein [Patescibacteria group bacterium]
MFQKITLKNGLRVISVPQKNAQSLTVLVLVGTGSKYETKETNGISHFLEHMYFKGTKKRPTYLEVAETLDKVGGIYNAFTGEDYTGYFAKVDALRLDLALDWVSDIFLNSKIPSSEIKKEKGVIIEEINMRQDHPSVFVQSLWTKLLYGDQPAGWDIAGTKESVSNISRQQLLDYMKNQYVAKNTVICVAGKVQTPQLIKKIKRHFSKIRTLKSINKPKVIEQQSRPQCLLKERKTDQAHLCLGVRAFNLFHPEKYVQEVLAIILGGMMSSRLFVQVREKLGMAYYISATVAADPDTGFLVTQAGIDNSKVELGISAILREYKKISQEKVSQNELKKAKDYIKGKTSLLLEPSDARALFFASQELLEGEILTPEEIFHKIDKISPSDILKVARTIFQPSKLNLALIGPSKNTVRLQEILNKF